MTSIGTRLAGAAGEGTAGRRPAAPSAPADTLAGSKFSNTLGQSTRPASPLGR